MELEERQRLFDLLFALWDAGWTLEDALISVRAGHLDWKAARAQEGGEQR